MRTREKKKGGEGGMSLTRARDSDEQQFFKLSCIVTIPATPAKLCVYEFALLHHFRRTSVELNE
jgi:hypothetical protein